MYVRSIMPDKANKPRRRTKKQKAEFNPSLREVMEIILEKYDMTLDTPLSELQANQDAMRGVVGVLSLALKDQTGIDWSQFLEQRY